MPQSMPTQETKITQWGFRDHTGELGKQIFTPAGQVQADQSRTGSSQVIQLQEWIAQAGIGQAKI